jgi:hypothetical protein
MRLKEGKENYKYIQPQKSLFLHVASSFVRVEIPSSNGSLGFSHV